jgi:hypothetical protein
MKHPSKYDTGDVPKGYFKGAKEQGVPSPKPKERAMDIIE